jgi:hypothetical protein
MARTITEDGKVKRLVRQLRALTQLTGEYFEDEKFQKSLNALAMVRDMSEELSDTIVKLVVESTPDEIPPAPNHQEQEAHPAA